MIIIIIKEYIYTQGPTVILSGVVVNSSVKNPYPSLWPVSGAWCTISKYGDDEDGDEEEGDGEDGDGEEGDFGAGEELGWHFECREQHGKKSGGVPTGCLPDTMIKLFYL